MTTREIRPNMIKEIASWWQGRLDAAHARGDELEETPDVEDVVARFHCTEEEGLRGLCVGEQRHWSGAE